MEKFNPKPDINMETAFETTYEIITGGINIQKLLEKGFNGICLLYDPYELNKKELKIILEDMLEYFIEIEEYEKCQEIKNIIESNLDVLISKITLNNKDIFDPKKVYDPNQYNHIFDNMDIKNIEEFGKNSIDHIIDMLKSFADSRKKQNRENLPFTSEEIWSMIRSEERKELFINKYEKFEEWYNTLDLDLRYFYIKRLLEEKPLIPRNEQEELDDLFDDIKHFDREIDYTQMVIRFSSSHTYISHSSFEKIKSIKAQLILLGIIDSTIETAVRNGKKVYTIFWSNKQRPNKINLN